MKKFIIILIVTLGLINCNTKEFDPIKWKGSNERLRGKMVNNLISSKILENKTRNEIEELLGDEIDLNDKCTSFSVDLGGLFELSYFLEICFDEKTGKTNYIQLND